MKKFLSFFILTGLIFSTGLFAADASSSSGSASSSGGPEVSDGSVTLVVNDVEINLSHEQLDLLGSRTIEVALAQFSESTTRKIVLSDEFDVATVQTLADILAEIAKTGSFDKSVARYVTRKNVLQVLSMLDYLQAELIESIVFERLVELGADLSDGSAYYFCGNIAQACPSVIDKVFTPQAVVPNLRMEKTLTGHTDWVRSVSWSPDGKSLASASFDEIVRVWNVANGESRALTGHTNCVQSVCWLPDGKSLASASRDHTVRLWNVANGESSALTGHTGSVFSVAWSSDGKTLASASADHIVRVWNVANGESRTLTGHAGCVRSVSWSPDGKSLASASDDRTVRVWNVANGESSALTGHTNWVYSVAWSPDGKTLASASDDHTVRVWNVANGESRTLTGHAGCVRSVSWSPDGKTLASASDDHTVRVWGNSELDACSPFQKLFILINLPKKLVVKPKIFKRVTLWFNKLLERVSLRAGDDESIAQWLGVYQSLPEQAKKLLAKDVQEKFEKLILSKDLSNKTGESAFREISSLMRTNKPASEVLSFFVAHEKEFGDQWQKVQEDIERYAAEQEKERGDGASSSGSSSSSSRSSGTP